MEDMHGKSYGKVLLEQLPSQAQPPKKLHWFALVMWLCLDPTNIPGAGILSIIISCIMVMLKETTLFQTMHQNTKYLLLLFCQKHRYLILLTKIKCFCYFQVGERIRVILDCDDNTLSFEKNYEFLGVAFRGIILYFLCSFSLTCHFPKFKNILIDCFKFQIYVLGLPDKRLYPAVSAVYGNTEVSMVYLGPPLDG